MVDKRNAKLIVSILCGWIMSYFSLSFLLGPFDGDDVFYFIGISLVPGIILGCIMFHVMRKNEEQQEKNTPTLEHRLKELKSLLDQGILTQEEFDEQKKKILSEN